MNIRGNTTEMNVIRGTATEMNVIQGAIGKPKYSRGASAYEVAVINGFSGTEEEWLASLKPVRGVDYWTEEDVANIVAEVLASNFVDTATVE